MAILAVLQAEVVSSVAFGHVFLISSSAAVGGSEVNQVNFITWSWQCQGVKCKHSYTWIFFVFLSAWRLSGWLCFWIFCDSFFRTIFAEAHITVKNSFKSNEPHIVPLCESLEIQKKKSKIPFTNFH